tara:strand:- start:21 stop:722 length:702 start_codon:yes stop_codon:yes gene_type:complete
MLALKQALSLVSTNKTSSVSPAWSPSDDSSLLAWYKNKVGVNFNASSEVTRWDDSSSPPIHNMSSSGDVGEYPTYNSATGELQFDASQTQHLQSSVQMDLTSYFTVGFKINATSFNNTVLGDNTSSNEYFKITSTTNLRIKSSTGLTNLAANTTTFGDVYVVITRDLIDGIEMWIDGVLQSGTGELTGSILIDAIGIRAVDINSFDGTISEMQIYNKASSTLTTNVNTYLSNI